MELKNISKLFFKDYYEGIDFSYVLSEIRDVTKEIQNIIRRNRVIESASLKVIESPSKCCKKIRAVIQYPGLITGVGLVHDSKKIDGAYNLGMHFDYTFGMPILYGSSVKGVLRQYFKEFYLNQLDEPDVNDLFMDIFEGKERDQKNDETNKDGKLVKAYRNKSIYNRDIFFDAVIIKSYKDGNGRLHLLENDSITPHGENPLKNPKPIAMLKIASGCTLEFRFLLCESVVEGKKYSSEKKLVLFKEILQTVGVGAKTNVGYGQLVFCN